MSKKQFKKNSDSNRFQAKIDLPPEMVARAYSDSIDKAVDEELGKSLSFKQSDEEEENLDAISEEDSAAPRAGVLSYLLSGITTLFRCVFSVKTLSRLATVPRYALGAISSLGTLCWGGIKWSFGSLKRLASSISFRRNKLTEEITDEITEETADEKRDVLTEDKANSTQESPKQSTDKPVLPIQLDQVDNSEDEENDEDHELDSSFSWAGLGIRVASIAAMLLCVWSVGYGARTLLFSKGNEIATATFSPEGEASAAEDAVQDTTTPDTIAIQGNDSAKPAPLDTVKDARPEVAAPVAKTAVPNAKAAEEAPKTPPTAPASTPPTPAASTPPPVKPATQATPSAAPATPTATTPPPATPATPATPPAAPATPAATTPPPVKPAIPATPPAAPATPPAAPATPAAATLPPEKPATPATPPAAPATPAAATPPPEKPATPATPSAAPATPAAATPPPAPQPPAAPNDPFALAMPLVAPPAKEIPTPMTAFSEPIAPAAPLQSVTPLAKTDTATPLSPLSNSNSLQPLKSLNEASFVPMESAIGIPSSNGNGTPESSFSAEELRSAPSAPSAPNVDVSVPKIAIDRSAIPPMTDSPPPETIPMIPSGESAWSVVTSAPPPPVNKQLEPSLEIPVSEVPTTPPMLAASKAAENMPPLTALAAPHNPALTLGANAPAIPAADEIVSQGPGRFTVPVNTVLSPAIGEPIDIPNEPLPILTPSTMNAVSALSGMQIPSQSPVEMVPPPLPEHLELAKTDPPLGARLQNGVQEMRDNSVESPRLRFDSSPSLNTSPGQGSGAARYSPKTAGQSDAMESPSVPASPDLLPMSNVFGGNELTRLNPTGTVSENQNAMDSALPPLSVAPKAVLAPSQPSYQRSVVASAPADVLFSGDNGTQPEAQNASTFRSGVDQEIPRSPETTELYTVQPEDTYLTISNSKFGTSLLYRALAVHNRRRGANWVPTVGSVIEIPTAQYLKDNYADILSRTGRSDGGAAGNNGYSIGQGIRYLVQEGDSVFKIAENQLKDSSRWRDIITLNADQLRDAKDLRPGMVITIPTSTAAYPVPTY